MLVQLWRASWTNFPKNKTQELPKIGIIFKFDIAIEQIASFKLFIKTKSGHVLCGWPHFIIQLLLKYNLIKSILKINFSKPYLSNFYLFLNISNMKGLDLVLLTINILIPQFHTLYTLHNWPHIKTNIDIPLLSCPLPKTKSSINNFMPSTQVKSTSPIHPLTCHSLRQIGTKNGLVLMTWAWALMFMAFF